MRGFFLSCFDCSKSTFIWEYESIRNFRVWIYITSHLVDLLCHFCPSYFHKYAVHLCIFLVGQVIPFTRGSAWEQPPPDLASYLYKNRIVYLGMSLVPSVTELILAEFLYLQYEDADKPIYLYINSTGTTKVKKYSQLWLIIFPSWYLLWLYILDILGSLGFMSGRCTNLCSYVCELVQ